MSDLGDKWSQFRERIRPRLVPKKVEEPEEISAPPIPKIVEWASQDASRKDFQEYLDQWLDRADVRARLAYLNHAETSFWLGYATALETLREHFTAWRDNRTPAPQKGIMP